MLMYIGIFLVSSYISAAAADLIQPLPPVIVSKNSSDQGTARIEDFLHDCYAHPALQRPFEVCLSATPLKKVVQLLAQAAKLSVVVDDAVSGVVPLLMVRGEPIGSVLHTVLAGRSPPLGILMVHNVLHVAPRTVLIKRARQLLLSAYDVPVPEAVLINWLSWTEPLKMRLEAMWQHCVRQHIGPQRLQYFFADDESRRVLVQGTAAQIRLFKEMVSAVDVALPQVRIEARIVLARVDFMNRFGVNAQLLLTGSGSLGLQTVGGAAQQEPWVLNTGAAAATGLQLPFLFGGSSATMNALNVVLNAAENKKLVRTLLAPQVMSVSGRKAVLHEGCSVPIESYAEDAVEGRTRTLRSANYRDIGVKIQLKPQVMVDGRRVRIDVQVENSHLAATSTSTHYPTITTSKVCNTVILNDGQTVLLGGLTQKESSSDQAGVPWLSKIPILGRLFSSAGRGQQERRLYLFLHAKLMRF